MSRREVLKASAGAGALAAGVGTGLVGSASAGIPTPRLSVNGNLIQDPSGNTVKLRGLNIADPKRLNVTASARGKDAEQTISMLTDPNQGWHPKVIRVPTQPIDIGEHTPGHIDGAPEPPAFDQSQLETYLEEHVDPVVDLCEERGVYCIIDFHRHWKPLEWGNMQEGTINQDLHEEVLMYWETVAPRYADRSHVLYELYNEPAKGPGMWGGPIEQDNNQWVRDNWDLWKEQAQPWVDAIRAEADNLVLIGSPGWSTSPEGALYSPFEGGDLAYTYHIYPGHTVSMNENWSEVGIDAQGTQGVYEEHPLVVTEFGWDNTIIDNYLRGQTSDFGEPFMDFLESSDGIHWTAWCADPIWLPKMFELGDWVGEESFGDSVGDPYSEEIPQLCDDRPCEWNLLSGENMGQFIKDTLAANKDDGNPSGDAPEVTPTEEPADPTATPTPEPSTPTPDGPTPTDSTGGDGSSMDHDGDGLYEDVNGNGESDFGDVTALFDDMDSIEDGSKYDFNENGELDFGDVVALFDQM